MALAHYISIVSAVSGSAVVSLGMVLQKKGVSWLTHKKNGYPHFTRDKIFWLLGFALNNSLIFFYYFALKGLDASIVGSMMALNIIFTSVFSALVLREPISKQVTIGSLALIFFIVLAHLSGGTSASFAPPPLYLIVLFYTVPFFLVLLALVGRRFLSLGNQAYGSLFALAAGCLEGIIIVIVKAIQNDRGDRLLEYLETPYPYMYVIASIAVVSFMQVAYLNGKMTKVAPVLWGAQIAYPVMITYLAFSVPMTPIQVVAFGGILLCVILIQSKHPELRS
jgi:drug/metabolite transporter (DMT)-like permease